MPLDSHRIHETPDDLLAAIDYCYEQGWTDGLPVIPPVIDRVDAHGKAFGFSVRHDDPYDAAISSREAAEHYGLTVIAEDVGDRPAAFTRFVAIAPYTLIERGERWRTALSFVTDHSPGSLYHALGPFHRHGLNLVQLVSRPIPQSTFPMSA